MRIRQFIIFFLVSFSSLSPRSWSETVGNLPAEVCAEDLLTEIEKAATDAVKLYLMMNLSFPQNEDATHGGLAIFVLLNQTIHSSAFDLMLEDGRYIQRAHEAMKRTHAAHGIQPETVITQQDIRNLLLSATMDAPYRAALAARTISPMRLKFASTNEAASALMNGSIEDQGYQHAFSLAKDYSQTILSAMRSPHARDLSENWRQAVVEAGDGELHDYNRYSAELNAIIEQALIANHPELNARQPNSDNSLAAAFWITLRH